MEYNDLKDVSLKSLKQQRDELALVVSKLEDAIKILEGNQDKPIDWKNKALVCIKSRDQFLSTVDILDCMFFNEQEKINDERKRRNYISALSLALNNLCKDQIIGRVGVPGHKGFYYGLKTWFNEENGGMQIEYKQKLDTYLWEMIGGEDEANFIDMNKGGL